MNAAACNAGRHTTHGPVRAQDGRYVWLVVRRYPGCTRPMAVLECLSYTEAARLAQHLNLSDALCAAPGG